MHNFKPVRHDFWSTCSWLCFGFHSVVSVALVGLPGSGKTTVGRQLARRLKLCFVDSDQVIEEKVGCLIRDYFSRVGEDQFRDLEQEVINELTLCKDSNVLSTGGGAVLRPINRQHLRERGLVVYLRTYPEELFRRLKNDKTRPLLQVADPLAKLKALYSERDPLYRETAHFVLETGKPSVAALVNMIQMQLDLAGDLPVDSA